MIKGLILSIQFLTRIPINIAIDFNEENLARSTFFFPLVGAILGGIGGLTYYLFSYINKDLASFLVVVALIIGTGGLHLDGLGDTFDGFFSNRNKERILEIMKDSRTGTFGVIAIVLDILFKYILISNFQGHVPLILILSLSNSRLMVCHKMACKEVARPGGLGDMFHSSGPKKFAIVGGIVYVSIIAFLNPIFLIPLVFTFIIGEVISHISYKKIGGFTGDVYGAAIEIGEIASLLAFMGVLKWI